MRNMKLHVTEIRQRLRYWQGVENKAQAASDALPRWKWRQRSEARSRANVARIAATELEYVLRGGRA